MRAPAGRVVQLVGADPEAITLAMEPLPADAPALVTCEPRVRQAPAATVTAVLDALERAAVALFPAWLPGADQLDGAQGTPVAAARELARRKGAATGQYGPFLADLARRALTDRAPAGAGHGHSNGNGRRANSTRFAAELRAAGLARVIADSFERERTALLVRVPDGLTEARIEALLAACEWLAHHGGFVTWLTAAQRIAADRVPAVRVELPARIAALGGPGDVPVGPQPEATAVHCPPVAGRPHPGSRAEQALEAALAGRAWAAGRVWNRLHRTDPLAEETRVDLLWEAERCAVEIDGPEHRGRLHYRADRLRDVRLQLAGYAVLRFTNEQVDEDLAAVVSHIEAFLTLRRSERTDDAR